MLNFFEKLVLVQVFFLSVLAASQGAIAGETELNPPSQNQGSPQNSQYPNGISQPGYGNGADLSLPATIDVTPDPTIQIGPGVVVGPGVFVNGKPIKNPLLKDVLPPNHPLLINQ